MLRYISPGSMTILILAILGGLVGAYAIRAAMVPAPQTPRSAPQPLTVPLASAELPAGRIVTLGDIGLSSMARSEFTSRDWPLDKVMLSADQIIGRTLNEPLAQGQPFLTTNLYLEGMGPDLSQRLKAGFRAVSLQVPNEQGGFVNAGTFVDVIFRTERRAAAGEALEIPETTLTLMEAVEVLAVERSQPAAANEQPARGSGPPPTVYLAVTPEQATSLGMVQDRGDIWLVGRPQEDSRSGSTMPVTLEDLLGLEPPLPEPSPFVSEIYRAGQKQVLSFEEDRMIP